jgi:hypothetical protein
MDQSKHYANYQTYTVSHNDSNKSERKGGEEVLYRQSDEDYLYDNRSARPKTNRGGRTYHVQNYYESPSSNPDFTQLFPNEPSRTSDTVQYLPPNLFFRPGEYNPFKHF